MTWPYPGDDDRTIYLELTFAQALAVRSAVWWMGASARMHGDPVADAFAERLAEAEEEISAALRADRPGDQP